MNLKTGKLGVLLMMLSLLWNKNSFLFFFDEKEYFIVFSKGCFNSKWPQKTIHQSGNKTFLISYAHLACKVYTSFTFHFK